MNRLAIHESVAADLEPTDLITVAQQAEFDSVGLKVAHGPGAERWWSKGAGAEELVRMVDHLLASRVSVLDIGRVELGDLPDAVATTESYRGVLDLGTRLGAHFVTAAAVPSAQQVTDVVDLFGQLVLDCDAYQLIPLLVPQPDTSVATHGDALEIVRRVGGGLMINVSTAQTAFEIECLVMDAGNHLGYLRMLATDLDAASDDAVAGLLATVPVHVPIAVGSAVRSESRGTSSGDLLDRARGWYRTIDIMLEHPRARAERKRRR